MLPIMPQLSTDKFTVVRAHQQDPDMERIVDLPCQDTFSVIIQLKDFTDHRLWRGGRLAYAGGYRKGSVSLPFLGDGLRCQHRAAYDNVRFNIPRKTFDDLQKENGANSLDRFIYDHGSQDTTLYHLANAILPALNQHGGKNNLFLDHIFLAVCDHALKRYGRVETNRSSANSTLTTKHANLAKEMIVAHLAGNLSIEMLAAECSLSRSHFSRAFKQTVGMTPHAWLLQRRIEKAKELLVSERSKSISSIATECGFSDQSHLTRMFARAVGAAPGAWRRQHEANLLLLD